ncbi:MAG: DUF1330 domain-containing protein [Silicimonas sp.]|nr:DUF1330 domain-containing protein [Silicimonas sp.]
MSVFLIADIKVTDEGWVPGYAAQAHEIVAKHGGRYLTRSANIEVIEGETRDSTLIAIILFPDRAALASFLADPDYAPLAAARQAGSLSSFRMVDESDVAGTIPYLTAAA